MTRKKKEIVLFEFKSGKSIQFLAGRYGLRILEVEEIIRRAMKEQKDV